MKKVVIGFMTLLSVLALTLGFVACGGDKTEEGSGKGTRYSIQAPSASDVYTVENLPEGAYEGDTVTFKVTLAHPADSILDSVQVIGTAMGGKEIVPAADGTCSFTMPAEPVRVTVDASYYPDNQTDNFLSWNEGNATSLEKWQAAFEGDEYYSFSDDVLLASSVTSQPSHSSANMALTSHTEKAFSLNQSVIPDEALSAVDIDYSDGNQANAFTVRIDRSKVSAGTAKIVLIVENGHKFGDKAVLACTVTVTEPEPLTKLETWTETVVFDLSAILRDENTEDLYFTFEDLDWDKTMYAQHYQTILDGEYTVSADGKVTVELKYAVGHKYSVTLDYRMSNPPAAPSMTVGASQSASYTAGELTFSAEGGSIEFILG